MAVSILFYEICDDLPAEDVFEINDPVGYADDIAYLFRIIYGA